MIWIQPELKPGAAMFSSEKLSSPFSCSHSVPVFGSNAMPNELRRPYEWIFWTLAPTSPPSDAP